MLHVYRNMSIREYEVILQTDFTETMPMFRDPSHSPTRASMQASIGIAQGHPLKPYSLFRTTLVCTGVN